MDCWYDESSCRAKVSDCNHSPDYRAYRKRHTCLRDGKTEMRKRSMWGCVREADTQLFPFPFTRFRRPSGTDENNDASLTSQRKKDTQTWRGRKWERFYLVSRNLQIWGRARRVSERMHGALSWPQLSESRQLDYCLSKIVSVFKDPKDMSKAKDKGQKNKNWRVCVTILNLLLFFWARHCILI